MTPQQAFYFIEAQARKREQEFRQTAVLLRNHALQAASAISRMFNKKARFVDLDKLYPEQFGKKKKVDTSHMTPEEIQKASATAWKAFLGVK